MTIEKSERTGKQVNIIINNFNHVTFVSKM